jgi:dipeptidyl aminopeptidase/acylaminoacyl peptidase
MRRPYTIRDQVELRRLQGIAVSPDGRRIVLKIERLAPHENALHAHLWIVNADGSGLRQITRSGGGDSDPTFAPDGRTLYYISRLASGGRQIVALPLDGGEPVPVTASPVDVESFILSRDGRRVAFSAAVFPDPAGDTLASTARRLAEDAGRSATGRIHDRLFVRHWDEWKAGRRRHLFVQGIGGGRAVDVMPAMDADAPSRPFGGHEQFTFTPDGVGVVFTARDAGREEAWSTDLDLFLAPVDGSAPPVKLTTENRAADLDPSFSPDGTTLAYLAMSRPGYEADKQTVVVRDWPDGRDRRLTDGWDRSAESLAWSPDGRTLYVTAEDTGQRGLFAVDVATGSVRAIVDRGHVSHVRAVGDRIFYVLDSLDGPADLYVVAGSKHARLTRLNETRLRGVALGEAEQFSFAGWNGETVHGYLVRPPDFDASRKYPIAFIIHGGPQSSSGNDWHYRWNPQVYAAAGYAVVMIDFHGSTGYGQAFTDSIRDDWGGKPLEDLRKGYAAALDRYPFLDPSRAAALGASFGGYMINLIAGLWNEPWRCLVTHDGNLDERFAYFATEELWFPEWEHAGTPWENPASYEKHSPVHHIAAWRVPTLVIHGALDYRVSDAEGLAVFTALQRRGVPSRLLYFPDENHWVLKPANSVLWHDTVLDWLARWMADAPAADAPAADAPAADAPAADAPADAAGMIG